MNWLDHIILWGYLLSTVWHGWYFYRQAGNAEHFMAGGGKIPAWAAGFSVLGTFLSSVTFLTYPGLGCTQNWNTLVFALTMPLGALFAHFLFIPFYRRMGVISIFSYLEKRFNLGTRMYGNACMFIAQFFRAGVALYLVCLALVTVMNIGGTGGFSERQWTVGIIFF
ncbi:MAG TPA: hypothetical protein VL860_12245, partial [Planctomycetota bacterium]|nr:hypothetical protein [Planctomycetota bacterium]